MAFGRLTLYNARFIITLTLKCIPSSAFHTGGLSWYVPRFYFNSVRQKQRKHLRKCLTEVIISPVVLSDIQVFQMMSLLKLYLYHALRLEMSEHGSVQPHTVVAPEMRF